MQMVSQRLNQARRVWRTIAVGSTVLRGLTFVLLALVAGLVADNIWNLPQAVRVTYAAAFLGLAGYMLGYKFLQSMRRPLTDEMVARHVEKKHEDLDNRLINAVLLHKERIPDPVTQRMVRSQLDETVDAVRQCDMKGSTSPRPLWKWGKWVITLAAFVIIYGMAFTQHFTNAVKRYATPHKQVAPVTDTRLTVRPEGATCLEGDSLLIEAHCEGQIPAGATIYYDFEGDKNGAKARNMTDQETHFAYEFVNLKHGFKYWVKAGDATSKKYHVAVQKRPKIEELSITYRYPDYTGVGKKTEISKTGNIKVLTGTHITIRAKSNRALSGGDLELFFLVPGKPGGSEPETKKERVKLRTPSPQIVSASFQVGHSGQYRIKIVDENNIPNEPVTRQIQALPDEPAAAKVIEPGKDITAGVKEKIAMLVEVRDDFSLRKLTMHVQKGAGGEWEEYKRWKYEGNKTELREGTVLSMEELKAEPGEVYRYFFRAHDGREGRGENTGKSRTYEIKALSDKLASSENEKQKQAVRRIISKMIAMQKGNLGGTEKLGNWNDVGFGNIAEEEDARKRFDVRAQSLVKAQEEIYATGSGAVRENAGKGGDISDLVEGLATIVRSEISRAVEELKTLSNAKQNDEIAPAAKKAAQTEKVIIAQLEKLLEDPRGLLAKRLDEQDQEEDVSDKEDPLLDQKQQAEKMLEKLRQFQEDQRKISKLTRKLADKAVDQFTDEEEEKLKEAIAKELEWANYFQKKANDLSDLPQQDFGLASMAKEHMEVYSEVQAAADALKKKATEIACSMEESAAGGSEKIEENIEKWLTEGKDNISWKMEAMDKETPAPVTDLPEQLEDLIGDLMAEEDELSQEAEDANANSLSSMDKGIGWDTADGPLANMSAKGVTGNKLPNENNVGGRSGEGRTGMSSGQMVEDTATGKGGRKTPTRKTPDPFEAGHVKDTAPEPPTGATGGGKASGWGRKGFQGQAPPQAKKMKRMARQQKQLIDKAQRLKRELEKRHYPTGKLTDSIGLMKQLHEDMELGEHIPNASKKRRVLLKGLAETKGLMQKQKQLRRDRSALIPEEIRDEIASSERDEVPREYKPLVDNYFRSLAENAAK